MLPLAVALDDGLLVSLFPESDRGRRLGLAAEYLTTPAALLIWLVLPTHFAEAPGMKFFHVLRARWRVAALVVAMLATLATTAVLVACSGDSKSSSAPAPKPPAGSTLEIPSCAATRLLADGEITELTVTARNASGAPLAGATVLFVAPEATPGGTFEAASKYGPGTSRVRTDSKGVATARFAANGASGTFLVDALLENSKAAASFGISLTSTKPKVSGDEVRCQLEAKYAPVGSGKLLHGPVLLPAGTKASADNAPGSAASTVVATNDSWFAWVDEAPDAKYEHPTRLLLQDATDSSAALVEAKALYWPELTPAGGGTASSLISAWRTHDFGATPEPESSAQSVSPSAPGSHATNTNPSPGGKACAVVVWGLPDNFLRRDAELMVSFFMKRGIKVFTQRTPQGLLAPPTPAQIEALLDAAKADGCQIIYFYVSSHGGTSGLDKINDGNGGKTTILTETVEQMITSRFANTGIEFNPIIDACYSGVFLAAFQGAGLTGTFVTAADGNSESGAGLNYEGEVNVSSYFSAALRECWRDNAADTDKSGSVSVKEAGDWTLLQGDTDVTDPKPQIICIDPAPKAMALPPTSIACPGDEVVVQVAVPGPNPITALVTGKATTGDKLIVTVTSGSEDENGWNTLIFDNANQQAKLRLRGEAPGQTTYSVKVFVHPFMYGGTATVNVGECGDGGVDAGDAGTDASDDGGTGCQTDPLTKDAKAIGALLGGWTDAEQCATWVPIKEPLFNHSAASIAPKAVANDHTTHYGRFARRQAFTQGQLDALFGSGGTFPCGTSTNGITLCPPGAPQLVAGDLVVISEAFHATIPTADATNRYQYGIVFDSDNTPGNNYQANAQYADDLFKDTDRWYEANYAPSSGWALKTSSALNGNIQPYASKARLVIHGNSITLVLPATEIGFKAPYRLTAFRHTGDFGMNPPYDYDGCVWPLVGQTLTPSP